MVTPFYGRDKELAKIRSLKESKKANLVVIKGRRRIGKSRLIKEFSKEIKTYNFIGLPPKDGISEKEEREYFAKQLEQNTGIRGIRADDWTDLLYNLAIMTQNQEILIVFDEINWMGSKDPTFLGKLKSAWDLYFSQNPNLILILSGSMSGWIERNIIQHTGFFGRISLDFTLEELPLSDCACFWGKQICPYEIFKVLSVTGGVPRYLEEIDPAISAERNLQKLCFTKEGYLYREFNNIFSDLFNRRAGTYKEIVAALIQKPLSLSEITLSLKKEKGGVLSEYLEDLEKIGYLERNYSWSISTEKKSKFSRYRLKDNYLRFYLKYIDPQKENIALGAKFPMCKWDSIMGLQFENLVLNNRIQLLEKLEIPVEEIVFQNPYFQTQSTKQQGCQIDYLVQTKYNALYPCEIKFSKRKIGKSIVKEMEKKIAALSLKGKKYSIRPVLLHVNGVDASVEKSEYFSKIINFSEFLKQDRTSTRYRR